jgi:putative nucleotidyltransferase with HDIG domain
MTLQEAQQLVAEKIKDNTLLYHLRETQVIMQALAEKLGEDQKKWGITGLLHDLDWLNTENKPEEHGLQTAKILEEKGVDQEIIHAIKSHNHEYTGVQKESRLDYALHAAESVTGLIVAMAMVLPDKRVAGVKTKSIMKRMRETAFARNVNRQAIQEIEKTGLPLSDFVDLSIKAVQGIAGEVGL